MISIQATSFRDSARMHSVFEPPYLNLMPVVHALVARGNVAAQGGFVLSKSGWMCIFRDALDFDFVRSEFEFPSSIVVSESAGAISDKLTWCTICGPITVGQ
jgi:hypothetical protein